MEGNAIIAAIMVCTMVCVAIWPLFAAGLAAAAILAYLQQWLAAGLLAIPCLWIVGLALYLRVQDISGP